MTIEQAFEKWKSEQTAETLEEFYKKQTEVENERKFLEFRCKRLNKELGENSNYEYVIIEEWENLYIVLREKKK